MGLPKMVEDAVDQQSEEVSPDAAKAKRERSLVEFPYADLQSAYDLAFKIMQKGGGGCDESQLAAWLNQSVSGGTFRSRLSASKMFGLVEGGNKTLSLTMLGRKLVEPSSSAEAKVDAFLHIPLYNALYEKLGGFALPPAAAVERQMVSLGVVPTQSDRARQAFLKSATQAGFIDGQTGRFVKPGNPHHTSSERAGPERPTRRSGGEPPDGLHPFILGLLKTLPEPGAEWTVQERAKWLQTASSIFGLIYVGDGTIRVEVQGE